MVGSGSFRELVVRQVRPEAENVVSLVLAPPDGQRLPAWEPGAHVDVLLGEGAADGLVRQYSLCSAPTQREWRIAVLRERVSRGGSAWVHDRIREGDTLLVGAPRNNFALRLGAGRHVFVAGGIGITPLLPMVASAEAAGADWALLYLGASAERMAFVEELRGHGDQVVLHRDDEAGLIDLDAALDRLGAGTAAVHACGPAGLLAALEGYAGRHEGCDLVLERFTADPDRPLSTEGDHAFVVETGDGTEVAVGADETILQALTRTGIPALSSCQEGICGTCETTVLSGEVDHRDALLSPEEQAAGDTMMICVSRCRGDRLVLDI